jgi:hypothetical protein
MDRPDETTRRGAWYCTCGCANDADDPRCSNCDGPASQGSSRPYTLTEVSHSGKPIWPGTFGEEITRKVFGKLAIGIHIHHIELKEVKRLHWIILAFLLLAVGFLATVGETLNEHWAEDSICFFAGSSLVVSIYLIFGVFPNHRFVFHSRPDLCVAQRRLLFFAYKEKTFPLDDFILLEWSRAIEAREVGKEYLMLADYFLGFWGALLSRTVSSESRMNLIPSIALSTGPQGEYFILFSVRNAGNFKEIVSAIRSLYPDRVCQVSI